jgi:hypothetical protein
VAAEPAASDVMNERREVVRDEVVIFLSVYEVTSDDRDLRAVKKSTNLSQ